MIAAELTQVKSGKVWTILKSNGWATWTGIFHAVLFLVFLILANIDHRTVDGLDNWFKPMKFALSISIFALTLPFLTNPLQKLNYIPGWRSPVLLSRIVCLMLWGEIILISFQAARGERSHFNIESPLGGAIYGLMGLMILTSSIATLLLILPYFTRKQQELNLSRNVIQGIRFGSVLFMLGSVAGGLMSSILSHSVGQPGANQIPFLGWSTTAGDIRAVHFLGLHAIQILPLIGWLGESNNWSRSLISATNWLYTTIFGMTTGLTALGLSVVFWI